MDRCFVLIVLGAIAQGAGFGLALYEIAITRRRELPEYVPLHHRARRWTRARFDVLAAWVLELVGHPPKPQPALQTVTSSRAVRYSIDATVPQAPATTLEERMERVESNLLDLSNKQHEDVETMAARILGVDQRSAETSTALRVAMNNTEAKRKVSLAESVLWERIGIGLFLLGLGISTWGSLCSA